MLMASQAQSQLVLRLKSPVKNYVGVQSLQHHRVLGHVHHHGLHEVHAAGRDVTHEVQGLQLTHVVLRVLYTAT